MENNQNNNQQHIIFRQGDVILQRIPENTINKNQCIETGNKTIALGEVTGHHHSFRNQDQVLVFKDTNSADPKFVKVAEGQTAVLEHQEHLPLEIPEGVYTKSVQIEYNPFLESMVRVVD